jgi:glycosyltransferase involved in cell wall biosynthesis
MPKLLNINTYHYRRGGADVVYLEHAKLFEQAGWATAFFAMNYPENDTTYWSRYFVNEIDMGRSYSFLQKAAIAKQIIHSRSHANAINRLLDDFPADVAHVHNIYHHMGANILSELQKRDVRVVMTAHDLKLLCPAYRMYVNGSVCERCKPNAVYNCAAKRCMHGSLALSGLISLESAVHRATGVYRKSIDRIVCPSRFYLEKHVEWGWSREQLIYIPNDFAVPLMDAVPEPGNYLCYFGRLSAEKGVSTVILACAKVGMPLHLVGVGPDEESLRRLAAEAGADVVFHGRRSGEGLFSIVRGARACVLASEWYENAPKSVLEAFGLGKAVIGADIGGISEMIDPGKTGWLFPSGDVDELAAVLGEVQITSASKLIEMGGRAAEFARRNFSTDLYLQRMTSLYSELGVGVN